VVVLCRKKKQGHLGGLAQLNIDDMIHMTLDEFQELVVDLFRAKGYRAEVVGSAGGFSPEAAQVRLGSGEF
jgi:hypothetical protein